MNREFRHLAKPYLVTDGRRFTLAKHRTRPPRAVHDHKKFLKRSVQALTELQEKLYAQDRWGVLLIFQAMDGAGKDSAIKHVMSGVDPKGCQVFTFKAPSSEELDHDFMWRTSKALPERGRIGIFNRSYYEETLVVRVHPEILGRQKMPAELVTGRLWSERFQDINAFERYLTRQGFVIRKFFLNVSRREQRNRFLDRLERPEKQWKFSMTDLDVRARWRAYMAAYEQTIRHTATPYAPWVVVPADDKKFARIVVASAVIDALADLNCEFPTLDADERRDLQRARRELMKS